MEFPGRLVAFGVALPNGVAEGASLEGFERFAGAAANPIEPHRQVSPSIAARSSRFSGIGESHIKANLRFLSLTAEFFGNIERVNRGLTRFQLLDTLSDAGDAIFGI